MVVIPKDLSTETKFQNGQYGLRSLLYRNEFELVFLGVDLFKGCPILIKTLNPQLRHRPDFSHLHLHFKTIAQHLYHCQCPSLIRVLRVFEERGLPFMVIADSTGKTLATILQSQSPYSIPQATQVIRQVALALSVAHHRGVLHCNLDPSVILQCSGTQQVILSGFGLTSELTQAQASSPIRSRSLTGGYAAIEQYLPHEPLSPATDIYGLAAVFYSLLTGKPPLEAPLLLSQTTQTLLGQPQRGLPHLHSPLTPTLERLILWGLELEPQHRPQTVEQWLSLFPQSSAPVIEAGSTLEASSKPIQLPPHSMGTHPTNPPAVPVHDSTADSTQPSLPDSPGSTSTPNSKPHFPGLRPQPALSWKTVSGLVVFTALFSGWLGFAFTRFYSRTLAPKAILSRQSSEESLPTYDPSKPTFEDPSIVRQRNRPLFRFRGERDFDPGIRENDTSEDLEKNKLKSLETDELPPIPGQSDPLEAPLEDDSDGVNPETSDALDSNRLDPTLSDRDQTEFNTEFDPKTPIPPGETRQRFNRGTRPARDFYWQEEPSKLDDSNLEDLPPIPQNGMRQSNSPSGTETNLQQSIPFEVNPSDPNPDELPPIPLPDPSGYNPNPPLYIPYNPSDPAQFEAPGQSRYPEVQSGSPFDSAS
ncbi:MAG: protein kinase [Oscillatoriales cyanobacterium SM2_3_0]|nr:protein kinase [Oscillatoriales cyanobacterium SM2_3_0]